MFERRTNVAANIKLKQNNKRKKKIGCASGASKQEIHIYSASERAGDRKIEYGNNTVTKFKHRITKCF